VADVGLRDPERFVRVRILNQPAGREAAAFCSEDSGLRIEDRSGRRALTVAAAIARGHFYGTLKGLFVFGSLTSVPDGKPRTSMMNFGSYGLWTKPGLFGTTIPFGRESEA
jgi:hypothetical protein